MQNPPLVPTRLRPAALIVALLCWLATALLGGYFAGERHAGWFDRTLIHAVFSTVGQRDLAANVLVSPTTPVVVYALIALLGGVGWWWRRWEIAALAVVGPGLAVLIDELVLKPWVDRRYHGYLSYPSGHTASTVAVFTVALLLVAAGAPTARRWLAGLLWLALAGTLSIGLVAMDYHYPTDTIGGFFLALGVVLPAAVLADTVAARRHARETSLDSAISRDTARRYFLR